MSKFYYASTKSDFSRTFSGTFRKISEAQLNAHYHGMIGSSVENTKSLKRYLDGMCDMS